jgi:hypothetical protein
MPIFNRRTAARLSALLASTALFGFNAHAQSVGTAAAVNPTTEAGLGGGTRVLRLGGDIVKNETVRTSAQGSAQILFIDKTTLNIGPASSVTIDNYVFNPDANTGQAAITLGKGVMRFVGGEISHSGRVQIKTPVATAGVRGGTITISHGADGTRFILHYGSAEIETPCGKVVLRRPGYAVTVAGPGECPSAPELATKQEIKEALANLTSGPGQSGGGTFTGEGPQTSETFEGGPNNPPIVPPGPPQDLDDFIREQAQNPIVTGGGGGGGGDGL